MTESINKAAAIPTLPAPRRVEWSGPEGWIVWADEDGCHVRSARGDSLEQCDMQRLFDLWGTAQAMWHGDRIPAPRPTVVPF